MDVRVRLLCTGHEPTGGDKGMAIGLRLGKDRLSVGLPVAVLEAGQVFECTVRVDGDEIDRPGVPRFKGPVVQGSKGGRYLELDAGVCDKKTSKLGKVVGGSKIPLTDNGTRAARAVTRWITHDMARVASESGGYLYAGVVGPFHETGSATLLGQGWYVVRGGASPPALDRVAAAAAPKAPKAPKASKASRGSGGAAANDAPFDVLVRVTCQPAPPGTVAGGKVMSGLQRKDDRRNLLAPVAVTGSGAGSKATFELQLRVSGEELGRPGFPRFVGPYVWGNKSGRFLKLMLLSAKRPRGGGATDDIVGGVKVLLTHNGTRAANATTGWITMDMARAAATSGSCLAAEVVGPPHAATSTPLLGDGWQVCPPGAAVGDSTGAGAGGGAAPGASASPVASAATSSAAAALGGSARARRKRKRASA